VFLGLEQSAKILAKNIAEETVQTVQHKWVPSCSTIILPYVTFVSFNFVMNNDCLRLLPIILVVSFVSFQCFDIIRWVTKMASGM